MLLGSTLLSHSLLGLVQFSQSLVFPGLFQLPHQGDELMNE